MILIKKENALILFISIALAVGIVGTGCEGTAGTEGAEGPAGPSGLVGPDGEDGSQMYADNGAPEADIGGTGATESDKTSNGLAIRAVNTGSEDFEISYGGMSEGEDATGSTYCYSESGCEDLSGGDISIIYPENEGIINESNPEDGKAVGVKISLHVDAGTGYFEVVRGESYRDDAGFREFNPEEVVSKTDTYSEGDLVEFEWGKTD